MLQVLKRLASGARASMGSLPGAPLRLPREAGTSLVALMVSCGIAGILMLAGVALLKRQNAGARSFAAAASYHDAHTLLLRETHCNNSLRDVAKEGDDCVDGAPLALRNKRNKIIVKSPTGVIEDLTIRAVCRRGKGIQVIATKPRKGAVVEFDAEGVPTNPDADFEKDPLLGVAMGFAHPKAKIFGATPTSFLCPVTRLDAAVSLLPTPTVGPQPADQQVTALGVCKNIVATYGKKWCPGTGGGSCQAYPTIGGMELTLMCPSDFPVAVWGKDVNCCSCENTFAGFSWVLGQGGYPSGGKCRSVDSHGVPDLKPWYEICLAQGAAQKNGRVVSGCQLTCCKI